ncbi:hypothetical protein SFRURICE_010967 [Spodoptera frugiperda]|nr:hypothetical protein SFRURICE_010967 [Spodoptera frugiperda]
MCISAYPFGDKRRDVVCISFLNVILYYLLYRECVNKHISQQPHTQTRDNILWITQRVAPCGNRTRYTLRGSCLPSHHTNCALKVFSKKHNKTLTLIQGVGRRCI